MSTIALEIRNQDTKTLASKNEFAIIMRPHCYYKFTRYTHQIRTKNTHAHK